MIYYKNQISENESNTFSLLEGLDRMSVRIDSAHFLMR